MDKKFIILIGAVIIIIIAAIGSIIAMGIYNDGQADINLKNAYGESIIIGSDIKELNKLINDYSDEGIGEALKLNNNVLKANKKEKEYLENAIDFTSDDGEKEYINILLEQNELEKEMTKNEIMVLNANKQFNDGKISSNDYNNKYNSYIAKFNKYSKTLAKNYKEIKSLLKDNPKLDQKLESIGINGGYYLGIVY